LRALRIPAELVTLVVRSIALDPARRPKDATEWERKLTELVRKKTVPPATDPPPSDIQDDPTELAESLSDSEISASASSQTITVEARGRWYSRTAGQMIGQWQLVTTTPAEVRVTAGEVYRFSIHSAGTADDVAAVGKLAGLTSLRYLNLSYCDGVTDDGLALLPSFTSLRQLFLRGCRQLTDAGLPHLRALTALHTLELTGCPGLTAEGLAALRNALPHCKVVS
jgi:hypothetical protein